MCFNFVNFNFCNTLTKRLSKIKYYDLEQAVEVYLYREVVWRRFKVLRMRNGPFGCLSIIVLSGKMVIKLNTEITHRKDTNRTGKWTKKCLDIWERVYTKFLVPISKTFVLETRVHKYFHYMLILISQTVIVGGLASPWWQRTGFNWQISGSTKPSG